MQLNLSLLQIIEMGNRTPLSSNQRSGNTPSDNINAFRTTRATGISRLSPASSMPRSPTSRSPTPTPPHSSHRVQSSNEQNRKGARLSRIVSAGVTIPRTEARNAHEEAEIPSPKFDCIPSETTTNPRVPHVTIPARQWQTQEPARTRAPFTAGFLLSRTLRRV
jgi:hypothetical protein